MITEEERNEDLRRMAVDVLNGIDNTNMNSDGLIRDAMDLMSNYGYRTYEEAMKRVLEKYNANPKMYVRDTPTRYTYMGQLWKELYNKPARKEDTDIKEAVNDSMEQLARDLIGFEPTGDSQ